MPIFVVLVHIHSRNQNQDVIIHLIGHRWSNIEWWRPRIYMSVFWCWAWRIIIRDKIVFPVSIRHRRSIVMICLIMWTRNIIYNSNYDCCFTLRCWMESCKLVSSSSLLWLTHASLKCLHFIIDHDSLEWNLSSEFCGILMSFLSFTWISVLKSWKANQMHELFKLTCQCSPCKKLNLKKFFLCSPEVFSI